MKICCITHADFETPGVIEDWARDKGYGFFVKKPYQEEACPKPEEFDFLIVMGGPQSPLQIAQFPYLKGEIQCIESAIKADKLVLGFCLGAQLIGEALGSKTEKSPEKEVGVFPMTLTPNGREDALFEGFPSTFPVIHWHNDMPGETSGSALLASSEGCPRQVLRYSPKVYGFQCHLEITKDGIEALVAACHGDLSPSKFTQTKEQLLGQDYSAINNHMRMILDRLVKKTVKAN